MFSLFSGLISVSGHLPMNGNSGGGSALSKLVLTVVGSFTLLSVVSAAALGQALGSARRGAALRWSSGILAGRMVRS